MLVMERPHVPLALIRLDADQGHGWGCNGGAAPLAKMVAYYATHLAISSLIVLSLPLAPNVNFRIAGADMTAMQRRALAFCLSWRLHPIERICAGSAVC